MNLEQLTAELDAMCAALTEKGHTTAHCIMEVKAGGRMAGYVGADIIHDSHHTFEYGDSSSEVIADMWSYITKQKSADVAAKEMAVDALGKAIDKLNDAGFEHDVTAPIVEGFKAMTENLLTHSAEAV